MQGGGLRLAAEGWKGESQGLLAEVRPSRSEAIESLCHFEIASKYCISDSVVDSEGYSISSKGFLPTVVYIMVI